MISEAAFRTNDGAGRRSLSREAANLSDAAGKTDVGDCTMSRRMRIVDKRM